MRNALNRENCLSEFVLDGIAQFDLSSYGLTDFDFGVENHTILRPNEYCRPDLLSMRIYGTTDLDWFLMWYNGISDPWHDLQGDKAIYYVNAERVKEAIRYVKDKIQKMSV